MMEHFIKTSQTHSAIKDKINSFLFTEKEYDLFEQVRKLKAWEGCDLYVVKYFMVYALRLFKTYEDYKEVGDRVTVKVRNAKLRKPENFGITASSMITTFVLQGGKCAVTGVQMDISKKGRPSNSDPSISSFDRKNNKRYYSKRNTRWVSFWASGAKGAYEEKLHKEYTMLGAQLQYMNSDTIGERVPANSEIDIISTLESIRLAKGIVRPTVNPS